MSVDEFMRERWIMPNLIKNFSETSSIIQSFLSIIKNSAEKVKSHVKKVILCSNKSKAGKQTQPTSLACLKKSHVSKNDIPSFRLVHLFGVVIQSYGR